MSSQPTKPRFTNGKIFGCTHDQVYEPWFGILRMGERVFVAIRKITNLVLKFLNSVLSLINSNKQYENDILELFLVGTTKDLHDIPWS